MSLGKTDASDAGAEPSLEEVTDSTASAIDAELEARTPREYTRA